MRKVSSALVIVLMFILGTAYNGYAVSESAEESSYQKEVDKIFAEYDNPDAPGCAVAIYRAGRIVYKKGYGAANLDYNIPVTPQTVFDIGSTSKQFTAAAIALLFLEGRLSLDDDIRTYIPEFPEYDRPITIRHLLHHTSGIRDYTTLWALTGAEMHNVFTLQDIVDICARQKNLNFSPGDEYLYSNSGYILLSVIIERVTGMSLGDYVKKKIFDPLGMKHTLIYEDRTAVIKNRATGYSKRKEGGYYIDHFFNFAMGGDGQVLTTVEDLFLWDRNFFEPKVGGKEFLDLMHTRGILNNGKELEYAFGLNVGEYRGLKTVQHGGGWGGFRSQLIRVPEHQFTVAVLSNYGSVNPGVLANQIIDTYLADHLIASKKPSEKPKEPFKVDPRIFDLYTGEYILEVGSRLEILKEKDHLWIKSEGRPNAKLLPVSETKYFLKEGNLYISFQKNQNKKVNAITLHIGDQDIPGKRIENLMTDDIRMTDYVGKYYCDELQTTYIFTVKEAKMFVQITGKNEPELNAISKDEFAGPFFKVNFKRNDMGKITGFSLDSGRVKNLLFIRKTP